jgi:siroheme synthase-like protein
MKFLPMGLNVRGRRCVVVGGGVIGTRKVTNLLQAGARVTLVSPEVDGELAKLTASGAVDWRAEEYMEAHLHGAFLAVVATNDEEVNARMVEDAERLRMLVCDASSATRSQVIFGALHHGDGVTVAVFTDGEDPSRARATRDRIGRFLSKE